MASQGYFEYESIKGVLSASMTLGLGISPSQMSFSCPPPAEGDLAKVGDAVWRYEAVDQYSSDSFSRTFRDCLVDSVDVVWRGTTVWDVTLLDRRWKWSFGQISGRYNNRVNGTVLPKNRKTLKELVELCLDAMGETGYDTSIVSEDDYPSVEWDLEIPARAMMNIVDEYGLTVSLQRDGSVKMVRLGFGGALPKYNQLTQNQSFDPSNHPAKIRSVSRPTIFQADLPLKAVGYEQETDEGEITVKGNALIDAGDIAQAGIENYIYGPSSTKCTALKPLADLSWLPMVATGFANGRPVYDQPTWKTFEKFNPINNQGPNGSGMSDPGAWGIDREHPQWFALMQKKIQLYNSNVFRLYQVDISTLRPESNIRLPIDFEIEDIEQILPLLDHNVGREGCQEDLRYKPPIVYGSFTGGRNLKGNMATRRIRYNTDTNKILRGEDANQPKYPQVPLDLIEPYMFTPFIDESYNMMGGFSIEPEFGLVRFNKPMYLQTRVGDPATTRDVDHNILTDRRPWEKLKKIPKKDKDGKLTGEEVYASYFRFEPAKIFLRVAIQVRRKDTGSYIRGFNEVEIDSALNTEPEVLPREDVHMQFMRPYDAYQRTVYDENGEPVEETIQSDEEIAKYWKDNRGQVDKELKNYNSQTIYNYISYPGATAEYAGFVDIDTDGAIKQISYSISGGVAKSSVSRNTERTEFVLSVTEARQRQRVSDMIIKEKKNKKTTQDAAKNVRKNFQGNA